MSGSRFYFLTGVGAELEFALINLANETAREHGFTQVIAPSMVKPRAMEGTGFLGQAADDVYRIEGQDMYLVGTSEVPMAAYHSDEILDGAKLPLRYAAFSPCFRKEAGSHGKDTKGIIRVHWFDKVEMFVYTTLEESYAEHQRLLEHREGVPRQARAGLPGHRHRGRRPRPLGDPQVRLRGVDPDPGQVPRAHLDLQLHRVPGPPPRHPRPVRRTAIKPVATLNGTLCASTRTIVAILETHQQADGSVQGPEGAAEVARAARSWSRSPRERSRRGWRPQLVALDIDGTILKWVEGAGMTHEEISPAVHAAVHRALDAGAHVVLASGRSPHGMTGVADLLDLYDEQRERLWIVASNGAVVFRYPPLEVVHEEKFDARPAVEAILERHPTALVAVEERGVGYRVNSHFPEGELSGDMIVTEVADLVAAEVSRVIIRDPDADRRRVRRARRRPRPARHQLRRRLDRLARPRPGRRLQGLRARARRARARPDRRRRPRGRRRPQRPRDVRVGPPRASRWARRSRSCSTRPTTSPAASTRTAWPPSSTAGSR